MGDRCFAAQHPVADYTAVAEGSDTAVLTVDNPAEVAPAVGIVVVAGGLAVALVAGPEGRIVVEVPEPVVLPVQNLLSKLVAIRKQPALRLSCSRPSSLSC